MSKRAKLIQFILQYRWWVSGVIVLITALLASLAIKAQFDNTIETYFLPRDIQDYRQFLDQFGSDELIVIAFEAEEDVFNAEDLALIDRLTREIEDLPNVRRVLSLTNSQIVWGDSESINFDPLIEELPVPEDQLPLVRQRAFRDPFIPGTVLSSDGHYTAIVVEVEHIIGEFDYKIILLNQIKALLAEEKARAPRTFHLGGGPVLDEAIFRYNEEDQSRYIPIMLLIMVTIIFAMFRRIGIVVMPLIVVFLSLIWTYGFLVLMGYKINIISTIITPLLMAVSVADSIHIVAEYLQEHGEHPARRRECIINAFENLFAPITMTSVTTIVGLLSLTSANLVPIRQFGIVAAFGVLAAYGITLFFLPVLLTLIPAPKEAHRRAIRTGFTTRLLQGMGRWHRKRALVILGLTLLLLVPAIIGISRVSVGTNSLDYFKRSDPVRKQTEWIDRYLGGSVSLEFFIDGGAADALKDPDLLRKMDRFQAYLKGIPGITGVFSAVDLVKALNRAFFEGDSAAFTIPDTRAGISQEYLLVQGSDEVATLLSDDYSTGRISARVAMAKSQLLAERMPEIQKQIDTLFGSTVKVKPTGLVHLMHQMETYLLTTQIRSFLIAFGIILVCMMILLRSVKMGLLAIIPNFLPILFTLALMPFLNIALDVGTVMIAGVALGLVVDDTIHFLSRLQREMKTGAPIREAIATAILGTGRPIIFTSVILTLGFAVLILASFNPVIHFGILCSVVIFLAVVFDLVVLPAFLGFLRKDQLL